MQVHIVVLIFTLFLFLRLLSLSNVTVLEDHDSIFHLSTIEIFRTGDIKQIIEIDPDASLMFGLAGALISAFSWSIETSARLLSLLSGIGIFFVAYVLGKRFYGQGAAITGLVLLSLNPVLIAHSIAILTEPFYVGMVYCGLLLFVLYHRHQSLLPSFFIGIVFGLAFLTRLEGIIFLGFIPLFQAVYLLIEKRLKSDLRKYVSWSAVFVTGFLLIAAIQISWASYKMGSLAIDGRQVWTLIIHEPGDRVHNEKLLGLDYSPSQTNIGYLKSNPQALYVERGVNIKSVAALYIKTVILNLDDLFNNRLITLVGFIVLIFFTLGIIKLYKLGKVFEVFLVFLFIIAGLIAPLFHNVAIRHIIIISPIIVVVAGVGLYASARYIVQDMNISKMYRYSLLAILSILVLSVWAISINSTIKVPAINREYDRKAMEDFAKVIHSKNAFRDDITISARKGYLAYYAGVDHFTIPYTDKDGLVQYCKINTIDYVLIEHNLVHRFPFYKDFIDGNYENNFTLLYETTDRYGQNITLFEVLPD